MNTIKITKMELYVPKDRLPIRSDLLIGYRNPEIRMPTDAEGEDEEFLLPKEEGGFFVWNVRDITMTARVGLLKDLNDLKEFGSIEVEI